MVTIIRAYGRGEMGGVYIPLSCLTRFPCRPATQQIKPLLPDHPLSRNNDAVSSSLDALETFRLEGHRSRSPYRRVGVNDVATDVKFGKAGTSATDH